MTTTRVRSPRGEAPKPPGTASLWPAVLVSVERITTAVHEQHRFTIHVLETLQMDPALSSGVRVSRPWPRRGDTVKPNAGWRRTEARWTDIEPGGSRKTHDAPLVTGSRFRLAPGCETRGLLLFPLNFANFVPGLDLMRRGAEIARGRSNNQSFWPRPTRSATLG
jgi:hypothetical protein